MSGHCGWCGAELSGRATRFCSQAHRKFQSYAPGVDALFDVISREGGATREECIAAVERAGLPASAWRWVMFALRQTLTLSSAPMIVRYDPRTGRYRVPTSRDDGDHWTIHLAARRMRELRNVREYAAACEREFASVPGETSQLWAVVNDEISALVRHFAFAIEASRLRDVARA